jgi:hypothetical protein
MTDTAKGVISEIHTEATAVSQTVTDTTTELRSSAEDIKTTIQDGTSLSPTPNPMEDTSGQQG